MKSVFLILGNQLFPHKHLRKYKDSTIFMCESFDLCTFQKHHKLKLILFLSSMRSYADELKKNKFKVNYIDLKKDFKISYEDATILSSGSEVEIACSASNKLFENNNLKIRVVSMSSFELFEKNDDGYKNEILGNKPIFAIEAGVINGWEKYIKNENFVGMSTFGESGPYKDLYKHFKITDDHLIEKIIKTL